MGREKDKPTTNWQRNDRPNDRKPEKYAFYYALNWKKILMCKSYGGKKCITSTEAISKKILVQMRKIENLYNHSCS